MSRRSRRSTAKRMREAQRDNFITIATPVRAASRLSLEDRRFYAPVDTYPRAQFHRSARIVVSPNNNLNRRSNHVVPTNVRFNVPAEVSLCVRRKQRRSVLFAKRRTGKGSRARKRHRNAFSSISC